MTLGITYAVALAGLDARLVEVQADISAGLPGLGFTGLADTSVVESRDRIRAAALNCQVDWPNRRITVALLPADLRKVGSRFDLAIALAVLAADGTVPPPSVVDAVWIAELGLDGRLRPVRGVLPSVVAARQSGFRRVVVARGNEAEARLVEDLDIRAADRLGEVVEWLRGEGPPPVPGDPPPDEQPEPAPPDMAEVAGQALAKRAVEIAVAGGHHLYLVGAPGAGKTMLARRLPGLLPPLDEDAALEVTAVHSIAGLLDRRPRLITTAPLQAPHHSASMAALVGGGSNLARPGAISLAHHGVLFLDEAAEFKSQALEALRQPLEQGRVVLHRSGGAVAYPARFQLVLAANPCPCGKPSRDCACAPNVRRRYQQRLSGPLLDRVDLRIQVDPVAHADLFEPARVRDTSAVIAQRVAAARRIAAQRWRGAWMTNAEVPGDVLRSAPWALPPGALGKVSEHVTRGELSARGLDRVLRTAWTIADLAGHGAPDAGDLEEALYYRIGGARSWAA
jgi:magnesium chelatase family protein